MKTYSEGAKLGLTLCSQSYLVGGNWGYLNEVHADYEKILNLLNEEKSIIKLMPVRNGVIVISNQAVLHDLVCEVDSSLITLEVQKAHQERADVEKHKCLKFLENIVKGTSKYGEVYNGFTEYNVGIYSSNDTSKIRLNGIEYPAYKLTVQEMLECLKQLSRFKKVYVKCQSVVEEQDEFVPVPETVTLPLIKSLELSPTGTGVFITFRVL